MIKCIRTKRLSIKNFLFMYGGDYRRTQKKEIPDDQDGRVQKVYSDQPICLVLKFASSLRGRFPRVVLESRSRKLPLQKVKRKMRPVDRVLKGYFLRRGIPARPRRRDPRRPGWPRAEDFARSTWKRSGFMVCRDGDRPLRCGGSYHH